MKISNKIFLSIVIIGVVFVVIGSVVLGISFIRNPFTFDRKTPDRNATIVNTENVAETFSQVASIDLKIKEAEINFIVADTASVETLNFENGDITVRFNDKTKELSVVQRGYEHNYINYGPNSSIVSVVNIYLPDEILNEIDIEIRKGVVNIVGFEVKNLDLELKAGTALMENLTVASSEIELGAGSVEFIACDFNNLSVESGVGAITYNGTLSGMCSIESGVAGAIFNLTDSPDNYFFVCKIGLAEITIYDQSFLSARNQTYGNAKAPTQVKIEAGIGSVEINHSI